MQAAIIYRIVEAIPDIDDYNAQQTAKWWALADSIFDWEKKAMILGSPTEQDRKDHREIIGMMLKLAKMLAKVSGDKKMEMLKIRLEGSWGMFHGMDSAEADRVLSVFK
jgi:hypothetical protein